MYYTMRGVTMNHITEIIEQIASGVDPTTGEAVDIEALREDPDLMRAIKKLNKAFFINKGYSAYSRYEDQYPEHVIIMKEGKFYSSHNASAQVLNRELGYKLVRDMSGRVTTGGPIIDKITGVLKTKGYSFIVVEGGIITQKYDGYNPFASVQLESDGLEDIQPVSVASGPDKKAYPNNLLFSLMQPAKFSGEIEKEFPYDIEARLETVFKTYPERIKLIFNRRFREKKTLQEIGEELGVSRERIRQLIQKYIRRMRSKAIFSYLKGESPVLRNTRQIRDTTKKHQLRIILSPEQISNFEFSYDTPIPISEIARRINALNTDIQSGTLSYKDIAAWLVQEGYLEERPSEEDNLKRRPTQKGKELGIDLEIRNNEKGEYKVVVYNYQAQKFIIDHLQNMLDYLA